ncbi:MAG: hypothetical protein QN183_11400 [Armatimonadota bacterium]|nr:hypothetical protein [Armatimonadota bacterium]MDR7533250.1 hypothetical protein [Armatimonadota bacterium]MDR7536957.1 hypothetical protein [Armatimonadota bacterium]
MDTPDEQVARIVLAAAVRLFGLPLAADDEARVGREWAEFLTDGRRIVAALPADAEPAPTFSAGE